MVNTDAIKALSTIACGCLTKIEHYVNGSEVIIGYKCNFCSFNTTKGNKYNKHTYSCPTSAAIRALSAEKIEMSKYEIKYALVIDDTFYADGMRSKIHVTSMPSPVEPSNREAKVYITNMLMEVHEIRNFQVYIVETNFLYSIGYVKDDTA
jgi:hypothetical protein